jgi:hypothetical protein
VHLGGPKASVIAIQNEGDAACLLALAAASALGITARAPTEADAPWENSPAGWEERRGGCSLCAFGVIVDATKGTGQESTKFDASQYRSSILLAKRGAHVTLLKLPSHSCKNFRVAIAWLHRRSLRCFPITPRSSRSFRAGKAGVLVS